MSSPAVLFSWPLQLTSPAVLSSCTLQLYSPAVFSSWLLQLSSPVDLSSCPLQLTSSAALSNCPLQLSCPSCPVPRSSQRASWPCCLVLTALSFLSSPSCSVMDALFCPGCSMPTVLLLLSSPDCPYMAVLQKLITRSNKWKKKSFFGEIRVESWLIWDTIFSHTCCNLAQCYGALVRVNRFRFCSHHKTMHHSTTGREEEDLLFSQKIEHYSMELQGANTL